MRRTSRLACCALAAAVAVVVPCDAARASYSRTATTTGALSTATLAAPTSPTATPNGNTLSCAVAVAWTASSSSFVVGYTVQRYKAGNPDGSSHVLGLVTSYNDSTGIQLSTAFTWTITARAGTAWTSTAASVAKTVTVLCL